MVFYHYIKNQFTIFCIGIFITLAQVTLFDFFLDGLYYTRITSPFRFKVYNTALVIATQQKKEEFPIQLAKISQCSFLIQIYKTLFSETKQIWRTTFLDTLGKCQGALCVYDQNYALVIVTQQNRGISNPIGQDTSGFISNSNIQKHFCLKLSSFGEVTFQISARVLCVYVCVFVCVSVCL